jgi:hypothetical protein
MSALGQKQTSEQVPEADIGLLTRSSARTAGSHLTGLKFAPQLDKRWPTEATSETPIVEGRTVVQHAATMFLPHFVGDA